jgi:hypothetical protein
MANVTKLAIGGTTNVAFPMTINNIIKHEIDIAEAVAAGLLTTEKVRITSLPEDTFLTLYQVEVINALSLGAGARIDIGDSSSDTLFVNNATTLTAGTNLTIATQAKLYTAADNLQLKVTGGTLATGRLRFVFGVIDTTRAKAGTSPAL